LSTPRTASIRIGRSRFDITSDDQYLRQLRPGFKNSIVNAARRSLGIDTFEPRMAKLFAALVEPTDVCLDVGANIGCTAILLAQLAKQVIAFEPTPRTFSWLLRNIETSGLSNVRCENHALGNVAGPATVTYSGIDRGGAFVGDAGPGVGETAEIVVQRLDDVFPRLEVDRVDFIKLDVEGFEGKVIDGGWGVISTQRPLVQMELNSWCLNALQRTSLPDFLDFLIERFPIVYGIEKRRFIDVRQPAGRFHVMHENIVKRRFKELVLAFEPSRLQRFRAQYSPLN